VTFYRRRLPHLYNGDQPVFLTWRLHGSLPPNRGFPPRTLTSGQAFAALDRFLDEARSGPTYLRRPAIADLVVEAIYHNATVLGRYTVHAFVVMPNHVHMLVSLHVPLRELTRTLKSFSAKRANQALGLTGNPFWQEESYDHLVRSQREVERIRFYIEYNPVRAGLVREARDYRWSSASRTDLPVGGRVPGRLGP
jgi:putative transposase